MRKTRFYSDIIMFTNIIVENIIYLFIYLLFFFNHLKIKVLSFFK